MNKNLLKNSFVLTGLLILLNVLFGIVIAAVAGLLKINSSVANIAAIIGAMLVGQLYAANFREVVPSKLKMKVVLLSTAIQLIFAILYMGVFVPAKDYGIFLGMTAIVSVIYALATYWMLSLGGKTYINWMLKKKKPKSGKQE